MVTQLILDRPSTSAPTNEALCADLSRYTVFDTITQDTLRSPWPRGEMSASLMRTDSSLLQLYRTNHSHCLPLEMEMASDQIRLGLCMILMDSCMRG